MLPPFPTFAVPTIELPPWAQTWLPILGYAMAGLFVLWLLAVVVASMHRRAYNLTRMEQAPANAPEPSFLKVDHGARAAAIRRGDDYVRPGAGAAAAPPPAEPVWGRLSRAGALVIALAHIGVVAVSMAAMAKDADEVVQTVSTADCIRAVVGRYWLGIALGLIVIVAEAARLLRPAKAAAPAAAKQPATGGA